MAEMIDKKTREILIFTGTNSTRKYVKIINIINMKFLLLMIGIIFTALFKFTGSLGYNTDQAANAADAANKKSRTNKVSFSNILAFSHLFISLQAAKTKSIGPKKIIASYDLVKENAEKMVKNESPGLIFSFNKTEKQYAESAYAKLYSPTEKKPDVKYVEENAISNIQKYSELIFFIMAKNQIRVGTPINPALCKYVIAVISFTPSFVAKTTGV
jgi:hypothetical protein